MKDWKNWYEFDQSIILYSVDDGKVYGGSDPERTVKQVQKDSDGYYGGDFTMELDLTNRSLVMWIDNEKIVLDENIGGFEFSPIVIFGLLAPEITLLSETPSYNQSFS